MNYQSPPDTKTSPSILPVWMQELQIGLPVRTQFVLSGNTRDIYPTSSGAFLPSFDAIWSILKENGYQALLVFDPVDGLHIHSEVASDAQATLEALGIDFSPTKFDLGKLAETIKRVGALKDFSVGLVVDYASQLIENPNELAESERLFFVAIDKMANSSTPLNARHNSRPAFNPIFWVVDYLNKMPSWFIVDNENIRLLSVGTPDLEERYALASELAKQFPDHDDLTPQSRTDALEVFALETEGMPLRTLLAIARLANYEKIALSDISDAIKAYQFGSQINPWKSEIMRTRIRNGEEILTNRVKGQPHAVRKTLDILIRSVMGLSGVQTSSRHGRPRGVLFFAGPTGVGKTELAKSVTELLFGDETAYHRFDMSELSAVSTYETELRI